MQVDMATVLAALGDPEAESAYREVIALEQRRDGYRTGYAAGWIAALKAVKRAQHGLVDDARTEAARWTVACRDHRLTGYVENCTRCEVRDRETFGQPHPDDLEAL